MTNKCNNCIHSNVCIHKQRYQKNYTYLAKEPKYDELFSIELDCKEYKSNESISYPTITSKDLTINLASTNPCEGCPIYEDMKKGKISVNDACNFCSNYPYKITAKCSK